MDGFYIVRGRDLDVLREELGVSTASPWWGFDEGPAVGYIQELIERGRKVVIATDHGVSQARLPVDRTKELRRRRKQAKYIAIEPRLLFDEKAIEKATNERWLRDRAYQRILGLFQQWLREGDLRLLKGFGELYVYQVGDWFEVDHDLTTVLESHILLLAKAAFATSRKLPCKLIQPSVRRSRSNHHEARVMPAVEATRLGQLRFDAL
jgi:hypothetical protein